MRDRGADIAQRWGKGDPAERPHQGVGLRPPAGEGEADHVARIVAQQGPGQRAVGVILAAGVEDLVNAGEAREVVCDPPGVVLRALKPQLEGMEPALRHPAIPRRGCQPPCGNGILQRLAQRRVPGCDIAQRHIGVPGQQLGHRIDHQIGAELEARDHRRGGECVVNQQQHPAVPAQRRDAIDIGDPQGGV